MNSTPPRTPSPLFTTSIPVSVIMKVNKDGTCIPDPFGIREMKPKQMKEITLKKMLNAQDMRKKCVQMNNEETSYNILKSLKYKMSGRKEMIFVESKDTNRDMETSEEAANRETKDACVTLKSTCVNLVASENEANASTCADMTSFVPALPRSQNLNVAQSITNRCSDILPKPNSSLSSYLEGTGTQTVIYTGGSFIPVDKSSPLLVFDNKKQVNNVENNCPSFLFFAQPPRENKELLVTSNKIKKSSKPTNNDPRRRIFECNYQNCGKNYFKSSHLKAHMRTHTGNNYSNFIRVFLPTKVYLEPKILRIKDTFHYLQYLFDKIFSSPLKNIGFDSRQIKEQILLTHIPSRMSPPFPLLVNSERLKYSSYFVHRGATFPVSMDRLWTQILPL